MHPEGGPSPTEEESVNQESQPQEKPGFLGRFFGRQREVKDEDEGFHQMERDEAEMRREEKLASAEKIKIPNAPEELVALMSQIDAVSWRERKIEERYGEGRLGKIKAFLSGERDFSLTEDGQLKRNAWNELSRKALNTVFNRKTALAAGSLAIVGALTGGVGLPAAGALFGSIAGKGTIEAWHSLNGKERGLREEMARSQYRQWVGLRELAQDSEKEGISEEEKNQKIGELVDTFYRSSEEINVREKEILKEEKIWNRRRNIGMLLGGLAGAGIGVGLSNLSEQVMRMDINGDGVRHLVEKVNGSWHYLYNSANEVASAASHGATLVPDTAGYATHALGEPTSQVILGAAKNLAPTIAQIGAVFGGLMLGRISEKRGEAGAEEKITQKEADAERLRKEEREFLGRQVPAPEGTAGAGEQPPTEPEAVAHESIPEHYRELAEEEDIVLPEIGKTWIYRDLGDLGILKIKNIDWANGWAVAELLNRNFEKIDEASYRIDDLIKKGQEKSAFTNDWLLGVSGGGKIRLGESHEIRDRLDPTGEKRVEGGDYQLQRIEQKPQEAFLVQEGKEKQRVNIFDLAFWGVRPLEPEKKQDEKVKAPKVREIWAKRPDVGGLPAAFQDLERITISDVEDGIIYYQGGDRPIEDIKLFCQYFRKVGGGGQAQGRQQGGGQRR